MGDSGAGVVLCVSCKKVIRGIPGRPDLVQEGTCDACKAGSSLTPSPTVAPAPSILVGPHPVSLPRQPAAAPPSTTDLVIRETANILSDKLIAMFTKALAAEGKKEPTDG